MIYIDSDGVMSDFDGWVKSKNMDINDKRYEIDKLMVDNYKEVFLEADKCKNADIYLGFLKNNSSCFVLTAVPNYDRLHKEFPEIEDMFSRITQMKENKYLWYEKYGVPRYKVIIVDRCKDKVKYCSSDEDVLIDDYKSNIDNWIKKGGVGVLIHQEKNKKIVE